MKSDMDDPEDAPPSSILVGSVYKSLRFALCDLLSRLGSCDDQDPVTLPPLLDDLESVLYLVERYKDHEERRVYPIVKEVAPTAIQRLLLQHQQQAAEIAHLRELACRAEPTGTQSNVTLERLYLEFSRFVANTLLHLYDEEHITSQALAVVADHTCITQIQSTILNDMGPDERALFRRALLPSTRPTWRKHVGLRG